MGTELLQQKERLTEKRQRNNDNIKYLDMWLDKSLRWAKHINKISDKVRRYLDLLSVVAGSGQAGMAGKTSVKIIYLFNKEQN
ncbi:unnamed protein product [Euphydryas editha]|uniref:Uncharacterized protein n=1 Tax=Euphydryas editha TaxID=104508 RepID=A0AAU9TWS9_EUPED|nr:unnamed protein product [Euphydryas editha]